MPSAGFFSMLPTMSKYERVLLSQWPCMGHSRETNRILRSGVMLGEKVIIQSIEVDEPSFTVGTIVGTFERLHRRSLTARSITAYRTVGLDAFEKEPEVGDELIDLGLMNVTLQKDYSRTHGLSNARSSGGYIQMILKIPKHYPAVPTLAHHSYVDSTGQRNVVSEELELTLKQNTRVRITNKEVDSLGVLTIVAEILP